MLLIPFLVGWFLYGDKVYHVLFNDIALKKGFLKLTMLIVVNLMILSRREAIL